MPFRTMTTLESWLEEFRQLGYPVSPTVRVIPQDGDEGSDTGLVAARLGTAPTALYVEPVAAGSTAWRVTFEPRDQSASLDPAEVLTLSGEFAVLSAMCVFFQAKSEAFVGALKD